MSWRCSPQQERLCRASPPQKPPSLRIEAPSAVSGAALELSGPGLRGKATRVSVGGKRAKVLSGGKKSVVIVVPKIVAGKKRVVALRPGLPPLVGRLRVVPLFDGTIEVRLDRLRARKATIGPAGGTISAQGGGGITYALEIPAGALSQETELTVTPLASIVGLPLTGGRPVGVDFAPDGLAFAQPATLRITYPGKVPADLVGFTHSGQGATNDFGLEGGELVGKTLLLPIKHFSTAGAAPTNPSDFAAVVAGLLGQAAPWSEAQAESVLDAIDLYTVTFGPGFCASQPLCEPARQRALETLGAKYSLFTQIVDPDPPVMTGSFTVSIVTFNTGPATTPSAKLDVGASASQPSDCSQLFEETAQLGDIENGEITVESFTVVCEQPTTISVTASASGVPADQEREPSDNFDTMQIVVEGGYDLNAIIREPAPPAVTGGFDLEVQAFNGGPSLAPSAKLEVSSSADDPSACSQLPSGTVQLGDIPADDGSNELFGVTCEQPTTISVTAAISGVPADQERAPADNFDTTRIVVEGGYDLNTIILRTSPARGHRGLRP